MTGDWTAPDANPFADLDRYVALLRDEVVVTRVAVNPLTLHVLRRAVSHATDTHLSGGTVTAHSVPVVLDLTVPDGKARLTRSDGTEELIP